MESLRELYRIGPGPSSSHTIGPQKAAQLMKDRYPLADHFKVILYGSLALTGKGHLTDEVIIKTLAPASCDVEFNPIFQKEHPNTMVFEAYQGTEFLGSQKVYSVGGGSIRLAGNAKRPTKDTYPLHSMKDIRSYLQEKGISLLDLVTTFDHSIKDYLKVILDTMFSCVERGLAAEGIIPGALKLEKIAKQLYLNTQSLDNTISDSERKKMILTAYAYAVSEENASGGEVVTAPTCGSAGVLSSLLYYFFKQENRSKEELVDALAIGGIFGLLIKENATISGAKGGCQAEVGSACSMAAASASYLMGLDLDKIEYAAEVAMEHHLGLTCDPILGYVQIPCIERNGAAALRAYDAALYGKYIGVLRKNRISFDEVVAVMKETGAHLRKDYRETALGGLAKKYKKE